MVDGQAESIGEDAPPVESGEVQMQHRHDTESPGTVPHSPMPQNKQEGKKIRAIGSQFGELIITDRSS
jgi:hypothetical protein